MADRRHPQPLPAAQNRGIFPHQTWVDAAGGQLRAAAANSSLNTCCTQSANARTLAARRRLRGYLLDTVAGTRYDVSQMTHLASERPSATGR